MNVIGNLFGFLFKIGHLFTAGVVFGNKDAGQLYFLIFGVILVVVGLNLLCRSSAVLLFKIAPVEITQSAHAYQPHHFLEFGIVRNTNLLRGLGISSQLHIGLGQITPHLRRNRLVVGIEGVN